MPRIIPIKNFTADKQSPASTSQRRRRGLRGRFTKHARNIRHIFFILCLVMTMQSPSSVSAADAVNGQQASAIENNAATQTDADTTVQDENAEKKSKLIVMIDPGHQERGNSSREKIGPGSRKTKKKVSYGTRGVSTHTPEYKLNLAVSKKLKAILEDRGYTVLMTRETNKVNISNKERAMMANKAKADVFIRIHANGSLSRSTKGVETICMTKNSPYNKKLYKDSYALSKCLLNETVKTTGAKKHKVMQSNIYTGINWSKVPVSIVEMGYMSNPAEDRKMAKKSYQNLLATGIANGIEAYFKQKNLIE